MTLFWHDELKRLKESGEYKVALDLAVDNLPFPAAFREAAICLRALIRAAKKSGDDIGPLLSELYNIAAYESFLYPSNEKPIVRLARNHTYPAFNVAEIAHRAKALQVLDYDYDSLGYKRLSQLNKGDIKNLVAAWGQPSTHATLRAMYRGEWDYYVDRLAEQYRSEGLI